MCIRDSSLQLVIYIMAVMALMGGDARFAGANYFNIHLPEDVYKRQMICLCDSFNLACS